MPETTTQRVSKPRFSMDMMIFSNMNELNKLIDTHAVEVEGGNLNAIFTWKAGMIQLYRNIQSFLENPEKEEYFRNIFNELDKRMDPINQTLDPERMRETFTLMRDLNSAVYEERNNTFIKVKTRIATIDKIMEYDFGILPKSEREAMRKKLEEE